MDGITKETRRGVRRQANNDEADGVILQSSARASYHSYSTEFHTSTSNLASRNLILYLTKDTMKTRAGYHWVLDSLQLAIRIEYGMKQQKRSLKKSDYTSITLETCSQLIQI